MITKISDSNPYKILKKYLQIQALVDLIQDYVTYHQDLFFSLRGGIPFPKLELTSVKILQMQHAEKPSAFSYPYVLYSKTIYSLISGESRLLPAYPPEGLNPEITCKSGMGDGLLMLSAYGALTVNPAQSALSVSFYRIDDLCLLRTTIFQFDKVFNTAPKCTFISKSICVFDMLDQGHSFMNPQTGVFLPPPFMMNPGKKYQFCVLNEEGAIYTEADRTSWEAQTHFRYGSFARHLRGLDRRSAPMALMGSSVVLRPHCLCCQNFGFHDIATNRNETTVCLDKFYDAHVEHNWVLFTHRNKDDFRLSLSKLVRAKENPAPITPSFGGCVIS